MKKAMKAASKEAILDLKQSQSSIYFLPGIRGFSRKGPIPQYYDWVDQARS